MQEFANLPNNLRCNGYSAMNQKPDYVIDEQFIVNSPAFGMQVVAIAAMLEATLADASTCGHCSVDSMKFQKQQEIGRVFSQVDSTPAPLPEGQMKFSGEEYRSGRRQFRPIHGHNREVFPEPGRPVSFRNLMNGRY